MCWEEAFLSQMGLLKERKQVAKLRMVTPSGDRSKRKISVIRGRKRPHRGLEAGVIQGWDPAP